MPNELRFAELRKLLENNGWILARINGSHHVFPKKGFSNIILPVHSGKVKPAYARKVEKILQTP